MRLLLLTSVITAMQTVSVIAQTIPPHFLDNMKVREIGPAVTSGRITSIDVIPGNPGVILAATASGGLWKSANGGVNWEPIFDKQPVLGIGAVRVTPSNPDVIWVGTGEGNPRNSQTSGKGIYRSGDGGRTWEFRGLADTRTIHRICIHPQMQEVIYAGSPGSAWGPDSERGVFRTTDQGKSWKKVLFVNDSTGCADLVMDPRNPDKLFAAMWQYQREPWFFRSGGKGSGIYLTLDGGDTWKRIGEKEGLPSGKLGRTGIAIAPSNPAVVYALVESSESVLYRSNDGGFSWSMINNKDLQDRPFYYHEIYVDPSNENHLIYLHSTVSESIDGGRTWKTILPYYGVHPDHHAFWWSPDNPLFMIEGNDGGVNISRDGGKNWSFAADIPVGQFYHINYDMQVPYHVYGGMQDNGSWKGPAYVWHSEGILESDWQEVLFGDGFDVVPDPADERCVYAMAQGGNLYRVNTQTGMELFVRPVHPEGVKLRFNWNAAIAADPFRPDGIFYGSQFVHYSENKGQSWITLSPDLTSNDQSRQKSAESGGLTIDATSAENHCTILAISPSPLDAQVIWVGTDDGQVQLTRDRGKSWSNLSRAITGMPSGAWIPQIIPSPHRAGEAWVVANHYRRNDWKPYLFHTTDFGKSWKNLVSEATISGHCLSMIQDLVEPNLLFLGTEHGLYVSINAGKDWQKWSYTFPSVATQDIKIHPREGDLIIGTFGRAAYIVDDITPLRILASKPTILNTPGLKCFGARPAVMAHYRRHHGGRFPADGAYRGENRGYGAVINYDLRFAVGREIKDKKTKITVLSLDGDTIRWFTHKPDTGMNRVTWSFERNGVRWPSRTEPQKDEDPPSGPLPVLPGKYRVMVEFDTWKDSLVVEVQYDPRVTYPDEAILRREQLLASWNAQVELAAKAFSQLQQCRKSISRIRSAAEVLPSVSRTSLLARSDSMDASIAKLENRYMLPEDARGIRDESDLILPELWTCMGWINSGDLIPGDNATHALSQLGRLNRSAADAVNLFFEEQWAPYRQWVESLNLTPFTDRGKL